jgi:hypothetical protein
MTKWTKEPPTEVGWYWWRINEFESRKQSIMRQRPLHSDLWLLPFGRRKPFLMRGEWWPIPITPPAEEQKS